MKTLDKSESSFVCGGGSPCGSISITTDPIGVSGDVWGCVDYLLGNPDTSKDFIGNEPNAHDPNYIPIDDRISPIDQMLMSY